MSLLQEKITHETHKAQHNSSAFEGLGSYLSQRQNFCHALPKYTGAFYKIIQKLQSNVLRTITNAPWYVSNFTLHIDLQIPFITEKIKKYSTIYYNRLTGQENSYVTELSNPLNVRRRLKRQ
jgi:hypothetical protein